MSSGKSLIGQSPKLNIIFGLLLVIVFLFGMVYSVEAADNIWDNSDGDYDGNVNANWSLGWVPKAGDVAVFDSAITSDTCTFSGALSSDGMRFDNAYAGTVDGNGQNITLGTDGLDCTGGGSATLDLGSGTWTVNGGTWDDVDIGTKTYTGSTVEFTGTSTIIGGGNLYNITVSSGTTTLTTSTIHVYGALTIGIGAKLTLNDEDVIMHDATGVVTNNGTIDGTGNLGIGTNASIAVVGTISCAELRITEGCAAGNFPSGTYDAGLVWFYSQWDNTQTLAASGSYTFRGDFRVSNTVGGETLEFQTNNASIICEGDVTLDEVGTLAWTAGSGIITASGSSNQVWNLLDKSVEDISIDKTAGAVSFSDGFTTDSFTVESTDASTIDFNDQDITSEGDMTFDGSGEVKCGTGTITCSGSFDNKDQGTWTYETSTLVMDGVGKTITGNSANLLNDLTIDGTITLHSDTVSKLIIYDTLTVNESKEFILNDLFVLNGIGGSVINGTLTINDGKYLSHFASVTGFTVGASGAVAGAGSVYLKNDVVSNANTAWTVSDTIIRESSTINAGVYGGTWVCYQYNSFPDKTLTFNGDVTFTGDVTFDSNKAGRTYTIDNSGNYDIEFQGDVTLSNSVGTALTWSPGSGTITASGSSNQVWNLLDKSVEDISIDKTAGAVSFSDGFTTDSFTVESTDASTIDFNDQDITSEGDMTFDGSGEVKCGTGTITCSGSFDNKDQGTWTRETSTLVMDGASKNLTGNVANDFYDLTIDGTLITLHADTVTRLDVAHTLTVNNGKQLTLDDNMQSFDTITNNGTISVSSGKTLTLSATPNSTMTNAGELSGDGSITLQYAQITNAGTWTIANTLFQRGATASIDAGTYGGTWLINTNGGYATTMTINDAIIWSGDVTIDADAAVDITLDNSGNHNLTFQGNVTLSATGGTNTVVWTAGSGSLDIDGDMNILSGSFTAPTGTFTLAGDFSNSGTFTHNNSTLTLDGTTQTVSGSSNTTFYNLSKSVSSADTLTFATAPTITVSNDTTLKGELGSLLSIVSSNSGTQASIDVSSSGTRDIEYVDVKDNNQTNSTVIACSNGCVDSGNNSGWDFIQTAPSNFAGSADSTTSITWTWTDNSSDEDGFKLYDENNSLIATISADATSYQESGLSSNTSYSRYIVSYNSAGSSSASDTVSVSTQAESTGGGPTGTAELSRPLSNPPRSLDNLSGKFKVNIKEGSYTQKRQVSLKLYGGEDAKKMVISNNPDLKLGTGQIPYQEDYLWDLCEQLGKNIINCPEGEYTVYVKFFTKYGVGSDIIKDTITLREEPPSILEEQTARISDVIKDIIPEIPLPFGPELPEEPEIPKFPPIEETVKPDIIPLVFQGIWQLVPEEPIRIYAFSPLPKDIQQLAEKFPELEETLGELNIERAADIKRLINAKLRIPGLTERAGLQLVKVKPGEFALPKGIPVSQLSLEAKQKLPTDIVFAKTAKELVDFNIALTLNEKGKPQQKISTIVGKSLQLVVKPDKPVKSIKGYVVFKSRATTQKPEIESSLPLSSLLASTMFSVPKLAQEHNIRELNRQIEERLVLLEFEYTDEDNDGIYTAEIQAPLVEGEYEIIAVMDYENPELGPKEIKLITVVDPEGYVFEKIRNQELRITGAIVSLYWLNLETKQYELWPAQEYQQDNPQITNQTGKYSFLVPEGNYYLRVEAPGYLVYEGKSFQIKEGSGIHTNIELKNSSWFARFGWERILLIVLSIALILVVVLLFYNFYRDKIRERGLRRKT